MQEKYRYGLWGAVAGAIALAIVGFTWGGWVSAGTAKAQADAAGWTALLPICAEKTPCSRIQRRQLSSRQSARPTMTMLCVII